MNEEIKNNEIEIVERELDIVDDYYEESSNGISGKVVVGLGIVGIGLGLALYRKNKNKINEWRIKKLEKQGYVVSKLENDDYFEDCEIVEEIDPDEK